MFYSQLNNLCKQHNTTPTTVVKILGYSTSKVTAWKKGSTPNGDIIAKIAKYFNVTTDYLLGNADDPTPPHKMRPAVVITAEDDTKDFIEMPREDYEEIKALHDMIKKKRK